MAIDNMQILALNDAQESENRIHSDEVAAKHGFTGALVSGANVFGYLSQPLTRQFGGDVLERVVFDVRFHRPAYHEETLLIQTDESKSDGATMRLLSRAHNPQGELLAELTTTRRQEGSPIDELYTASVASVQTLRSEIHWDRITLHEAAPDHIWTPSVEDNLKRVMAQRDEANIYQGTSVYIHPYYLLDACNKALMRMFVLPAWLHVGSRLTIRKALRVGQDIIVRAVPTAKWERKGHQFICLRIAMLVDDEIALEAEHTAIFRIAE